MWDENDLGESSSFNYREVLVYLEDKIIYNYASESEIIIYEEIMKQGFTNESRAEFVKLIEEMNDIYENGF